MASLDSQAPQTGAPPQQEEAQAPEGNELSREEELDLKLAVKTAQRLMMEGGLKAIETSLNESQDPAKVVGQFLSQLILQMHEQFPKDINVSPRIYLAEGGVLEQLLDFLEVKLKLPKEFSDQVFADVVEIFKAGAQGAQQQQPQAPPGPGLQGQAQAGAPVAPPQPGVM